MKMSIHGSGQHIYDHPEGWALIRQDRSKLLAIAFAPRSRVQAEHPCHALANRRWPTRVIACIAASLARSARSPTAVRR